MQFFFHSIPYLSFPLSTVPTVIYSTVQISVNLTCRAFGRTDCELVPSQNDTQLRHMFSPRPDLFFSYNWRIQGLFLRKKKSISPVPYHISIHITCSKYISTNCMAVLFCDVNSFFRELVRL
jgi:hypothetical protein